MSDSLAQYASIFEAIRAAAGAQPVYLVGGAVRDVLLGRPVHDLDFVLARDARGVARKTANHLRGSFYTLDEGRDVGRAILTQADTGERLVLDFAAYRSGDLESDLRARDFSINALALDLADPTRLIDPLRGAQDLHDRLLRLCAPDALQQDPARVLRAVRQALGLGLRFPPETTAALHAAVPGLANVSPERVRDELFRIFDGPNVAAAVRLLDHFGALPYLLPELEQTRGVAQTAPHIYPVWEHTLAVVQALESVLAVLTWSGQADTAANLSLSTIVLFLGRFRAALQAHLAAPLAGGRSLRGLLFLAALYHDAGKPAAASHEPDGRIRFLGHEDGSAVAVKRRAQALNLSGDEVVRLGAMTANHMRIHLLAATGRPLTRRAIYRFFRAAGPAGVDIALLTLADLLGTYGPTLPQETLEAELAVCQALLEAYWEQAEHMVTPPRLLSGADLIKKFDLQPGPHIGQLLDALQEAQATGEVSDQAGAYQFIEEQIERLNGGEGINA